MSSSITRVAVTVFAVAALALIGAGPASATTFCVPGFHTACPDNDSNVNEPSLEAAMDSLGADGEPDKVIIDAVAYVPPTNTVYPEPTEYSTDPLEIIGAGVDKSSITAVGNNVIAMNLGTNGNFRQRKVTFRDLTFVAPPASKQTLVQSSNDDFDGVNFESHDTTTGAAGSKVFNVLDGGVLRDVKIFGTGGGVFDESIGTGSVTAPGQKLEIIGSSIRDSATGVTSFPNAAVQSVSIRNSSFAVNGQVLQASRGEQSSVENSVIEAGSFAPFYVTGNTDGDSSLTLKNNTIVGNGASEAIRLDVLPGSSDSATATITDSIIRDFPAIWNLDAPTSPADGDANLSVSYSNLSGTGTKSGDGALTATQGVINEDPQFEGVADYHLTEGSPSIDAGNPAAGGLLTDFEGTIRPLDGNGDGSKVRDQGAYEAPTLVTCANDPSVCPDETGPKISKVKFKHGKSPKKGGTLKFRVSESSTNKITFKPVPAKKRGQKKRKTRKFTKLTNGAANVKIKIRKGKLRPGKYRLTIKTKDDSGNRGKTVVRKVRVKGK